MKNYFRLPRVLILTSLVAIGHLRAETYTWDAGGGGDTAWSTPGNWVGDLLPDFSAGDIFDLSNLNIMSASTSTVNADQTLGIINIGDSGPSSHSWLLNSSGGAILTLDNGVANAQINQRSTSFGDTISVPLALKGNLDIINSSTTLERILTISGGITSSATSGRQTISILGSTAGGVTINSVIGNGGTGGSVGLVVNNPNTTVRLAATNTYTGGTILSGGRIGVQSGSFGAAGSELTIDGPVTLGAMGSRANLNLGTVNILSDFTVNSSLGGNPIVLNASKTDIYLGNAKRTITLDIASSSIGLSSLGIQGSGADNTTINDGTLRIVGGSSTSSAAPGVFYFNQSGTGRVNFNNASFEIGANATTSFEIANIFGTTTGLPQVHVDTGGALNLSTSTTVSRSQTIASLSGSGRVTNANNSATTAVLTINGGTDGGNDAEFSGIIQNGGFGAATGVVAVTKTGTSRQIFSGANSYTGNTAVNGGVLNIRHNTALGATTNGTTVAAGAALEIENNITVGNEALTLNGTGISSGGALRNVGGNNVWQGTATLASATRINSDAGRLSFNTAANSITGSNQNLTLGGAGDGAIEGTITTGSGGVTKDGAGAWVLSGVNTYSGATVVEQGTLALAGAGSINNTSGISVNTGGTFRSDSSQALSANVSLNGGTFHYGSSENYSGALTFTNGTLAGTNWNGSLGNLIIGENQVLSPGNSPGTAVTTSQTWAGGGTFLWEINDATGTEGVDPGWDLIAGSGNLLITADENFKFTILVTSLTLGNESGSAANFDQFLDYQWLLADFSSEIDFDISAFHIETGNFQNAFTGTFGLVRGDASGINGDNTQLWLTYHAVPETSTALLLVFAGLVSIRMMRGKRRV